MPWLPKLSDSSDYFVVYPPFSGISPEKIPSIVLQWMKRKLSATKKERSTVMQRSVPGSLPPFLLPAHLLTFSDWPALSFLLPVHPLQTIAVHIHKQIAFSSPSLFSVSLIHSAHHRNYHNLYFFKNIICHMGHQAYHEIDHNKANQ